MRSCSNLERNVSSICDFASSSARLGNGNCARLRARRMRLETTMSDSGPVPRSHSPLDCVRLSRFIGGCLLLDRIAQAGGVFVSLRVDGTTEAVTQVAKLGLRCGM